MAYTWAIIRRSSSCAFRPFVVGVGVQRYPHVVLAEFAGHGDQPHPSIARISLNGASYDCLKSSCLRADTGYQPSYQAPERRSRRGRALFGVTCPARDGLVPLTSRPGLRCSARYCSARERSHRCPSDFHRKISMPRPQPAAGRRSMTFVQVHMSPVLWGVGFSRLTMSSNRASVLRLALVGLCDLQ